MKLCTKCNLDWPDYQQRCPKCQNLLSEYTCTECESRRECEFAFDWYNLADDCLAMK